MLTLYVAALVSYNCLISWRNSVYVWLSLLSLAIGGITSMTWLSGFSTPQRHLHEKQSTRSNLLDHYAEKSNAFGNV